MGPRVLVIEDNQTNLDLVSYILTAFGCEVLAALNATAGLDLARRLVPDLIICDIQMPGIDGYEVARRIRSMPATVGIPLVAVTALAMFDDRRKTIEAGFDGYIAKPIQPETFMQQLAPFLPGPARPVPPQPPPSAGSQRIAPRVCAGAGRVVLVVDDSADNLAFARIVLESAGYRVVCAEDIAAALSAARRDRPALILSDLHMPGGSGFDLLRQLKADPQLRSTPFVGISATMWREVDRARAAALGAQRFLYRPIEPEVLLAEIDSVLRNAGM